MKSYSILVVVVCSFLSMMLGVSCSRSYSPLTPGSTPTVPSPLLTTATPTTAATVVITSAGIWNDFDEGAWTGTVPFTPASYLTNGYVTTGDTQTIKVNTDPGSSSGISTPNGLELSGNFAAAGDVSEIVTEHGSEYGTDADYSAFNSSTMKLTVMVYSSKAVTVENVFIWDGSNHSTYAGLNAPVPANTWTQVVVPIGTHLQPGVADTAPWSNASGTGMTWTDTHAVGFDFTGAAGSYDLFIDNIAFSSSTPVFTPTPTLSPTRTATPLPTSTPNPNSTPNPGLWNDFDEGAWTGTVPFTPAGYLTNGYVTTGDTQTIKVNADPGSSSGISTPNGLELSGNFAAAGDVSEIVTENGANYGTDQNESGYIGSAMKLTVMVYSSKAVTVENVFIWDGSNHSTYAGLNAPVPANTWTQVVVPIGTHLQAGVADTAPWSNASGTGMTWTDTHAVGFDFTGAAGSYDLFIDNISFGSNGPPVTQTPTVTATPTISTTPPYNTPTPYNTPGPGVWNDFDNGAWIGADPFTPPGYLTNGYVTTGDTQTIRVNTDPYPSGVTTPNGLELLGHFAAAGDITEILTENGANYGTDQDETAYVGSTMELKLMVYSISQPVTVSNVFIWDGSNHSTYAGLNAAVPANTWTQVVVPIGTHLQAGVADTAPWSNGSGTGMTWTDTHAVGFDFTGPAGSYDFFVDDIGFAD